ncbi:hypothetical protein KSP40_PGU020712 [Platanthera guangdongensis]|uniref:PWWP domain-containing protein n=2 Tax=Platanthera guangdongensis TaxID=2320717 RepID=A0ABR2ML61_9ASPA
MEESTGGDGVGIGVDCGVGTIVWVRRRNGSWWPGRILGSDELSASHLMSPRSGTPVKLLGREDASVDWYNLEKSKRVKAFRCGEFDACIERAEASQGAPIKKREKYARREDAILHALELEKKQLEPQQQKLCTTTYFTSNKTSGSHKSEPANFYSPEPYVRHDENGCHRSLSTHKPRNIFTKIDYSHVEENLIDSSANKRKINKQFRWQDDNSEAIPRMRGLQDFGLRTVQSKRKSSQIVNWQNSLKPLVNHVEMLSGSGCALDDVVHASSSQNSMAVKRKRSQSRVIEESLVKKRDRRRPLIQVLQSSAKLAPDLLQCNDVSISVPGEKEYMNAACKAKRSKCVYFPHNSEGHPDLDGHDSERRPVLENQFGANTCVGSPVDLVEEYVSSGLVDANDSDSSEANYLEHDMGVIATMLTADVLLPGSHDWELPEFQIPDQFRGLNDDEIPNSGALFQSHENIPDASAEVGVSKWHMKGKRNTRNIGKRLPDAVDGKIYSSENCNGSVNTERAELPNQRALRWGMLPNKESSHTYDEGDLFDNDLARDQLNAFVDWTNSAPRQIEDDKEKTNNDSDNNSTALTPMPNSSFWEEPPGHFDPAYELEPLLVDIDLKVEATYQGEHVPLVSLMSRLNGKAIIGHPIQVELLESGSTGHLVSKHDFVAGDTSGRPPVWRTARRTAMQRVPRLNPSTAAAEDEDPGELRHPSLSKKCSSRARSRKFHKKSSRRLILSSQKTRTLSSLATNYKLDGGSNNILEGLIKPTEGSAPLVACIPMKVVFSRLLEAVGKPSLAIARRVQPSSPAVGDPL